MSVHVDRDSSICKQKHHKHNIYAQIISHIRVCMKIKLDIINADGEKKISVARSNQNTRLLNRGMQTQNRAHAVAIEEK